MNATGAGGVEVVFKVGTVGPGDFGGYVDKILLADRGGKPVLISAEDGSVARKIEFGEFQFGSDQIMLASRGRLYAVANDGAAMHAVCADI